MRTHRQTLQRGFTLIELLVAMTVLTILGTAIAAIMVAQIQSAASIQGQTLVQSDVNLALSMMRADLSHSGYGNATSDTAALSTAPAVGAADNLTLVGSNIGAGAGRWTVSEQSNATGIQTELLVRKWMYNDTLNNIEPGDSVKILSGLKQFIGATRVMNSVDVDSNTALLTLRAATPAGTGSLITQVNENIIGAGAAGGRVTYTLNRATRQLLRNGLSFMDNVEEFQVRYFWDRNGDGTIDSLGGETDDAMLVNVSPSQWNFRPILIGVSFVTVSPTQENKTVDFRASYTIWNATFNIAAPLNRRFRNQYSLYARPRNIGG